MRIHSRNNRRWRRNFGIRLAWVVSILWLLPYQIAAAQSDTTQSDPIPAVIKQIEMGSNQAAVVEKIKSIGTYASEKIPDEVNRMRIVWANPGNQYYKNTTFQFTEKDRLYLIRFTLNDAARGDYLAIKRAVFKDYNFSWDDPLKINRQEFDLLLYGPEKGNELYFCEFSYKKTFERSFELFDRVVSSTDREKKVEQMLRDKFAEPKATAEPQKDQKPGEVGVMPKPAASPEQSPPADSSKQKEETALKPEVAQEVLKDVKEKEPAKK